MIYTLRPVAVMTSCVTAVQSGTMETSARPSHTPLPRAVHTCTLCLPGC